MSKKLTALCLVLILLISGLTAFAEEGADAAYEKLAVGTLTAFRGNFFDDIWGNSTSDIDVRELLHAYSLIRWQHDSGAFALDESVVSGAFVTENGAGDRSYHLSLYNDLYFSDGTPITAADYAFTLLLETAPEVGALGANITGRDCFLGAVEYRTGQTGVFAGVRVLGEKSLSLTIRHDYLPSFYELGMLDVKPLPVKVIAPGCMVADDGEGAYIRNIDETIREPIFTEELLRKTLLDPETGYVTHPSVVSGPYLLTGFEGQKAEFEKNPLYKGDHEGNKPMIERLSYELTTNETMISALEKGELNLLNKVTASAPLMQGMTLVSNGSHRMDNYARVGASFFNFSCERLAAGDVSVRRAMAYAIDRDTLTANYTGSFGLHVDGYYGIGQWMFEMINGTIAPPLPEDEAEAEAEEARWAELTMDSIQKYDFDLDAAVKELIAGGWTLNEAGESFDPAVDEARCKAFDKAELEANGLYEAALEQGGIEMKLDDKDVVLIPLRLTLVYPEGNAIGNDLTACAVEPLAAAGVVLTVEPKPMLDVMDLYYRTKERDCDLIYIATNFAKVFDPSETFNPDDAAIGRRNRTGVADRELYELAVRMRKTQPGDIYDYCANWLAFQQRYQEVLPALSVYSNAYFDFFIDLLQDYDVPQDATWSQAILGAYLSDGLPDEAGIEEARSYGAGGTQSGETEATFGFEDITFEDADLVEFE